MARTPARQARATRSWRAWAASRPSASSASAAAATPFTSDTEGVNGKRPLPCHVSRQSMMDRNDPRGASGLASMAAHAWGLMAMSDMPGGPPRHFWGPATSRSSCHASDSELDAAEGGDDVHDRDHAPCSRHSRPISRTGLRVPEGVSQWTTDSTLTSGCAVEMAPGPARRSPIGRRAPRARWRSAPMALEPVSEALAEHARHEVEHGRARSWRAARAAASRPSTASPCIRMISWLVVRKIRAMSRSVARNRSMNTGS